MRVLAAAIVFMFFCGCGGSSIAGDPSTAKRIVKDDLGFEVSVIESPKRIVSLAPNITEILFALDLGPQVVGVTSYCNYPAAAQSITKVGDTLRPNLEQIILLKPDLVIVSTASQLEEFRSKMLQAEIPVFALKAQSVESILSSIETIGKIASREEKAKETVAKMRARLEEIKKSAAGKPRPKVFFVVGTEPLITAGRGAFVTDLISIAGGESISADVSSEWPIYSAETVIARAPDVILIPGAHDEKEDAKSRLPEGLQATPAASKDRIFVIDGDLILRPGPRIVEGIEEMAKRFHPEVEN